MRVSGKRTGFIIFLVLLLLAGIIALTQESDVFSFGLRTDSGSENGEAFSARDETAGEIPAGEIPGFVRPARWYRSNAGGMALEEMDSRVMAQANEYSLVIDFTGPEELPESLLSFYKDQYYIEIRILYDRGRESRRQWIFRDQKGVNRLVAVLGSRNIAEEGETAEEIEEVAETTESEEERKNIPASSGFIEIYDENEFITEEYQFLDDGGRRMTYYSYAQVSVVRTEAWRYTPRHTPGEESQTLARMFTDLYRYNRSGFLRAVERVYHEQQEINAGGQPAGTPIRISFPGRIFDAVNEADFIKEKLSLNPEFFGDLAVSEGYRMVYTTDERGRILTQTLFDDQNEILWIISNTWAGDRVASSVKTEDGYELLCEYEYDSSGKRIIERNFRNGVLERIVYAEGEREIEELYMNEQLILRAIWEDGRKVSEARIRHR